jgi:hypothetical protein
VTRLQTLASQDREYDDTEQDATQQKTQDPIHHVDPKEAQSRDEQDIEQILRRDELRFTRSALLEEHDRPDQQDHREDHQEHEHELGKHGGQIVVLPCLIEKNETENQKEDRDHHVGDHF